MTRVFKGEPVMRLPARRTRLANASSRLQATPDLSRRRFAAFGAPLLVLGAGLLAVGCGPVLPGSLAVPLDKIQQKIDARFPRRFPLAGLLELNLQAPRLRTLPEQGRINAVMLLDASGSLLRQSYNGRLDLDFALRYEPVDQTVRAHDVRVQSLQIDGLPAQTAQLLAGLGPRLAEQALRDVVLYQLQPKDLARAEQLGVMPGRIIVTAQGLEVEVVPRPRP